VDLYLFDFGQVIEAGPSLGLELNLRLLLVLIVELKFEECGLNAIEVEVEVEIILNRMISTGVAMPCC
jgi:hypothetical protein